MLYSKLYVFIFIAILMSVSCGTVAQLENPTEYEQLVGKANASGNPFTVVYGGVQLRNANRLLSDGGFSHVMLGSTPAEVTSTIKPENRAVLWTGVARGVKDSPWAQDKSPWNNNLDAYRAKWGRALDIYAKNYGGTDGQLKADFIVLDIESERKENEIFSLHDENKALSAQTKTLAPKAFIAEYKSAMLELAAEPVSFLKTKTTSATSKVAAYGDVPVSRNWYGIPQHDWSQWQTDSRLTNYMGLESEDRENPFAAGLNVHTPSAYYFKPDGQNLAYMLFQIEANRAWTDKDIVLFVTPRFVGKSNYGKPIGEELAEATAILPFFAGAKGLWFWETSKDRLKTSDNEALLTYAAFFRGLGRIGAFQNFFTGDYKLIIPHSGHEHFKAKSPIWRGVEKEGEILITAVNPFARDNEESQITVMHKGLSIPIKLMGRACYLGKHTL